VHLIDATNAEAYLHDAGRISPGERVTVRELAGGVSNVVLLVEFANPAREPVVLKQAREQLRVAQPWFCSPERIWREVEVLRACGELLADDQADEVRTNVPRILWEDREQFVFAMSAAPPHAKPWKNALMAGKLDTQVAAACGRLLGRLHGRSWENAELAQQLADRHFFEDLRVAPYYRKISEVHPAIAPQIQALIAEMDEYGRALVHGDYSPKNLLVSPGVVTLIDCEVGHYGDPTFDLGFFLTHLQLKALHFPALAESFSAGSRRFLTAYAQAMPAEIMADLSWGPRIVAHLRACTLARIDGKSPVEYLDDRERSAARALALSWFAQRRLSVEDALSQVVITARQLATHTTT
jgi:5-methylthioribose kinase